MDLTLNRGQMNQISTLLSSMFSEGLRKNDLEIICNELSYATQWMTVTNENEKQTQNAYEEAQTHINNAWEIYRNAKKK